MLHKTIPNRRFQDYLHAKKRKDTALSVFGCEIYKNFGQYREGKIHTSCPSAKTARSVNPYGKDFKPMERRFVKAMDEEIRSWNMGVDLA